MLGWLIPNPERYIGFRRPSPQSLSRQEHDAITESKLVHTGERTLRAQERWGAETVARGQSTGGRRYPQELDGTVPCRWIGCCCTPVTKLQQAHPLAAHAMNTSPQVPQGPPQASPPPGQFPNNRYMLVDPGANSVGGSPPRSRTDSPSYARLAYGEHALASGHGRGVKSK